jgi:hypothetical protein
VSEEIGHAGSGEASLPEEEASGVDEPVACWEGGWHRRKKVLDRK